jgi:hypothetical protein
MSEWRRTAIEKVPSCQRIIEQADNPSAMWILLFDELTNAYEGSDIDSRKIGEIYSFALECLRSSKFSYLSPDAALFFEYVIKSDHTVFEDLPNRISGADFSYLRSKFRDWF